MVCVQFDSCTRATRLMGLEFLSMDTIYKGLRTVMIMSIIGELGAITVTWSNQPGKES